MPYDIKNIADVDILLNTLYKGFPIFRKPPDIVPAPPPEPPLEYGALARYVGTGVTNLDPALVASNNSATIFAVDDTGKTTRTLDGGQTFSFCPALLEWNVEDCFAIEGRHYVTAQDITGAGTGWNVIWSDDNFETITGKHPLTINFFTNGYAISPTGTMLVLTPTGNQTVHAFTTFGSVYLGSETLTTIRTFGTTTARIFWCDGWFYFSGDNTSNNGRLYRILESDVISGNFTDAFYEEVIGIGDNNIIFTYDCEVYKTTSTSIEKLNTTMDSWDAVLSGIYPVSSDTRSETVTNEGWLVCSSNNVAGYATAVNLNDYSRTVLPQGLNSGSNVPMYGIDSNAKGEVYALNQGGWAAKSPPLTP